MNPNQSNNGLPPLPDEPGVQPNSTPATSTNPQAIVPLAQNNAAAPQPVNVPTQSAVPALPATPSAAVPPANVPTLTVRSSKPDWNATPWLIGIFFMIVLVAILALVALNLYSRPVGGSNNASSTSSVNSSVAGGFVLASTNYNTTTANWTYTITGNLPTPCHTVDTEAVVAESFPEQVTINVVITEPGTDIGCAQVIEPVTLTGIFVASQEAIAKLGTVTTVPAASGSTTSSSN